MERINTEEILQEIKAEVANQPEPRITFEQIATQDAPIHLHTYDSRSLTWTLWALNGPAKYPLHRNIGSGFMGFLRKVVRKCVGFLLVPMLEDQAVTNARLDRVEEQLYSLVLDQQKRIDELEAEIKELKS